MEKVSKLVVKLHVETISKSKRKEYEVFSKTEFDSFEEVKKSLPKGLSLDYNIKVDLPDSLPHTIGWWPLIYSNWLGSHCVGSVKVENRYLH